MLDASRRGVSVSGLVIDIPDLVRRQGRTESHHHLAQRGVVQPPIEDDPGAGDGGRPSRKDEGSRLSLGPTVPLGQGGPGTLAPTADFLISAPLMSEAYE